VRTILLTMYDGRTRLADQVADEVRNHFGDLVLQAVIPRNVRVSEAPGFGQTVMTYDAGSRGAVGYLQAAHELAERGRPPVPPPSPEQPGSAESQAEADSSHVAGETAGVDDHVPEPADRDDSAHEGTGEHQPPHEPASVDRSEYPQ